MSLICVYLLVKTFDFKNEHFQLVFKLKTTPLKIRALDAVLRIRDVYSGSRIRLFSIREPGSDFFPSRIRIKEFKYFNPKKWSLGSRKYDPGCSSRIRIRNTG
jgi:hypothetical protein